MIQSAVVSDVAARWRHALGRTSHNAFSRLKAALAAGELGSATWEELEAVLIKADVGVPTAHKILGALRQTAKEKGLHRADELHGALRDELLRRVPASDPPQWTSPTSVILIVGVNGSGKTTTIAKLAHYYGREGKSVLLAAADTFRAAAAEQLRVWAERLDVEVISGAPESDPGAVAFNTVQAGTARGVDLVFIDTAGRLHSKSNLMEELKKIQRVVGKALAGAPHAVWLVLDATTGQNALAQARAFTATAGVTGLILAKLDASARGGMAFAIQEELALPILFAGLGEGLNDLERFQPAAFVEGVLA